MNRTCRKSLGLVLTGAMVVSMLACPQGSVQAEEKAEPINLLKNGDFEAGNEEWTLDGNASTWTIEANNPRGGANALHYYNEEGFECSATQTVHLEKGNYQAGIYLEGGDNGAEDAYKLIVTVGDKTYEASGVPSGWSEPLRFSKIEVKDITVDEASDAQVKVYVKGSAGAWGTFDDAYFFAEEKQEEAKQGYAVTIAADKTEVDVGDTVHLTATVKKDGVEVTDLKAAGLQLWWWADKWAEGHEDGKGADDKSELTFSNYDDNSGYSLTADAKLNTAGNYYIAAEVKNNDVDEKSFITLTAVNKVEAVKDAEIQVERVAGLSEDFMMGMDISSAIVEFDSGVTYKDFEGKTIDNLDDFVAFLAKQGITHLRIRVWNDPKTADGKWYGGGNNDVAKAKLFADAARKAGIKMMVDFHVSDFWADPGKQRAPKAWRDYTLEQKVEATKNFIGEALETIDPEKDTVTLVQVGNETTGAFVGESGDENMCKLFASGSEAVRAYNPAAKVVIHVTNPEKGRMTTWAKSLDTYKVDYDMLATSYYPNWHGSLDNLSSEMNKVRTTYNKEVFVAETSYPYTMVDSDGSGSKTEVSVDMTTPVTVQGQATDIRNIIDTVNKAGGAGVFYWEPAWLTVGDVSKLEVDSEEYKAQVEKNKAIWEEKGSGWASSAAGEYGDDEKNYYGGSDVDDEAMFYPDGTPTAALRVWNYVKTGAESKYTSVDKVETAGQAIENGGSYTLPETIRVSYNKYDKDEKVTWNDEDVAKIDVKKAGTYVVKGTVALSETVNDGDYKDKTAADTTYTLTVKLPNLLTDPGFEDGGKDWTLTGTGAKINSEDPVSGKMALHYYHADAFEFVAERTVHLDAGIYQSGIVVHGRNSVDGEKYSYTVKVGEKEYTGEAVLAGWNVFQYIDVKDIRVDKAQDVTLKIYTKGTEGAWGSWDDAYINKTGDVAETPTEQPTETPTEQPTETPTEQPTETPTEQPAEQPTETPTEQPTETPTEQPTETPTEQSTENPTEQPAEQSTEKKSVIITLKAKSTIYTGKAVAIGKATVSAGTTGKITYTYYTDAACRNQVNASAVKNAGTYYVKAAVAADGNYQAAESSPVKLIINKAAQKIKGVGNVTVKAKKNQKKAQKKKLGWTVKAEGTLSYKIKGKNKAKLSIKKSGKAVMVVIPKKTKKGTYKIKVVISAKATANYKKASVTKKVTVRVK